jgi:uncharacterized membrane protein
MYAVPPTIAARMSGRRRTLNMIVPPIRRGAAIVRAARVTDPHPERVTSRHPPRAHDLAGPRNEGGGDVKVIGIKVDNKERGEFVLESLQSAVAAERVTLADIALVTKDEKGDVHIHQTKDITTGKGARRGVLVGALVGLAAPPLLGAAAVGGGIGALWGKFRDRGIDDDTMKRVGGMIADGEAVVFALGDDASIDALNARVKEVGGKDVETFTIDDSNEAIVREAANDIPEPSGHMVKAPIA